MTLFKTTMVGAVLSLLAACDGSQDLGGNLDGGTDAGRRLIDSGVADGAPRDGAVPDAHTDSASSSKDASEAGTKSDGAPRVDAGCVSGGSCTPTNACDEGALSCSSGEAVCTDTGHPLANGSSCGSGFVCSAGQCSACSSGAACVPSTNACHQGTTTCTSGSATCNDTGASAANGVPCGSGHVCESGQCVVATTDAGTAVAIGWCNVQWPPMIPDEAANIPLPRAGVTLSSAIYARVFSAGVTTVVGNQGLVAADIGFGPVGSDPTNAGQASQWSWQPMTFNSSCSGCGQNYEYQSTPTAPSTAGVYAYAARFSGNGGTTFAYCSGNTGTNSGQAYNPGVAPTMTVAASGCQQVGAACGGNDDCCAGTGSCQNSLCTCPGAGGACTPSDACHEGKTGCAMGTGPSCQDTGNPLQDGTSCGTDTVCMTGSCVASTCTTGAPCVPADPCDQGVASCNGNVLACNDTGHTADNGTSCGTGKVCNAGACVSCAADTSCTPANACHVGSTDCSSGSAVCTDTGANVANGTSCGTGEVCLAGSCGCTGGLTSCPPNGCLDLTSNSDNCKICGNACAISTVCVASACTTPPALPFVQSPLAVTAFASVLGPDGQVYVLGGATTTAGTLGTNVGGPYSSMYIYSPITNVWATGPSMPTARLNLAAAVGTDGQIYALGGTGTGGNVLDTVEIYNLTTKSWSEGPPMLIGRSLLGAAVGGDGRIYAVEGISATSGEPTLSAEALDTATQVWSSVASLTVAGNVTGFSVAAPGTKPLVLASHDGRIFSFGGVSNNTTSLEIYDAATGMWTLGPAASVNGMASGTVLQTGNFLTIADFSGAPLEYNPTTSMYSNPAIGSPTSGTTMPATAIVALPSDGRLLALGITTGTYVGNPQTLFYESSPEVVMYDPISGWVASN